MRTASRSSAAAEKPRPSPPASEAAPMPSWSGRCTNVIQTQALFVRLFIILRPVEREGKDSAAAHVELRRSARGICDKTNDELRIVPAGLE